jgi:hypothetical protein
MRIGGNENAKKFFKKQGVTDFHSKVCRCFCGLIGGWCSLELF